MQLREAITKRRSIRKYSHKKPDWRKIMAAMEASTFAPTAGNIFSMKYILVSDQKKIKALAEASQQNFIGTAPYVVVAVSNDEKLVRSYGERGNMYSRQQAGAAIENFLLALTEEKLATSWIGYFYEEKIKTILEIPEKMVVEALFPIGIETAIKTKEQKKVDFENIIYFDQWDNKVMESQTRVSNDSA